MTSEIDWPERIRAARARIAGVVRETPLLRAEALDQVAGRRVWVKAESLQVTGSFKMRGAHAALSAMAPERRAAGVMAVSSGNHAQGVAHAARHHGVPAVLVMPADAPESKFAGVRALGAEVVTYDRAGGVDRQAAGDAVAAERRLAQISPYDDVDVISGQATVGLELLGQYSGGPADVLICTGGGGLAAGVSLALDGAPGFRVRTVEPEGFDDWARSLISGERLENAPDARSICDAILTPRPGGMTFPIVRARAGPGIVVSDQECLAAMTFAARHLKLVLEPGGAAALAAALFDPGAVEGDDVIVVATGGNVDLPRLVEALSRPCP
ncbi:MAG: threonine/serine dehydratase [Pseudomonadota bacterium]